MVTLGYFFLQRFFINWGYGKQERPSKYLDKTDIEVGNLDNEGRGRDDMKEGVGEGRQERGQASEDIESEGEGGGRQGANYYLLADPRLAEAHDSGPVAAHRCSSFRTDPPRL